MIYKSGFRAAMTTFALLTMAANGVALAQSEPADAVPAETAPDVRIAEPVPATRCQLHVWPSNGLRSAYHGWFHGGIVDGAVTGRDGYPPVPKDPIPTALQAELLARADLPALLNLRGYAVTVHPEALESRVIRTSTTRIAPSTAPCYAELIADDIFFQQDVVNGGYLKSMLRFRSFGSNAAPEKIFGTFVQTKLLKFPPKPDMPEGNQAALDELQTAYHANLVEFGLALNKPPKAKRK